MINGENELIKENKINTSKDNKDKEIEHILEELKIEILKLKKELYQNYERERILLEDFQRLNSRYEALKQSKLGKITLWYWARKNKK